MIARVLVTGPQGSGKTTQAQFLAGFLNVPFIGTGDLVRQRSGVQDETGRKIKEALDSGQLADNETVSKLVAERAEKLEGFVMDGYPRDAKQLQFYDPKFNKVFYLDISDEEVLNRLLSRGREDDTPDLIKERLKIYHQETEPMLASYKEQGILEMVDGSLSIMQVQDKIRESYG
jgi:adenylate kinase